MSKRQIPVYGAWISEEDADEVKSVALSGYVSSGSRVVVSFEDEFARFMGAKQAVSCSNGTAALHLALRAAGIGPGDEVIVPDLTFVATASMVAACGATPIFADVSEDDWNVSPESVHRCVSLRTRAVMVVHVYGNVADCEAIAKAAPGRMIIEDAAECCGGSLADKKVGTLGTVGCFSFFGNKIITTGEGGMVTTDDSDLASRMRFLRGHAMSADRPYYHPELGFNYRMTGLQAAMGRSQLRRIDEVLRRKRRIAKLYSERLAGVAGLRLHPCGSASAPSLFWMYSILTPSSEVRDHVARELRLRGVETRPFFQPMSSLPPFAGCTADNPVSRHLSQCGLNLPSGPLLEEEDIDFITDALRAALGL